MIYVTYDKLIALRGEKNPAYLLKIFVPKLIFLLNASSFLGFIFNKICVKLYLNVSVVYSLNKCCNTCRSLFSRSYGVTRDSFESFCWKFLTQLFVHKYFLSDLHVSLECFPLLPICVSLFLLENLEKFIL